MIPYARENLINSKTDSVHFEGDVGELFDRFIRRRITDDFAVNEILRETETVFGCLSRQGWGVPSRRGGGTYITKLIRGNKLCAEERGASGRCVERGDKKEDISREGI